MKSVQSTRCTHHQRTSSPGLSPVLLMRWVGLNRLSQATNTIPLIAHNTPMQVKVVILGQDPYHGPRQAHGMCFSVRVGVTTPPSLLNIYKELESDIDGFQHPGHGYLMGWARQGVLLLNACLTVRARQPKSHGDKVLVPYSMPGKLQCGFSGLGKAD